MSDYLKQLKEEGEAKGYFQILPLKDLDKSCCSSAETMVIDFDALKEKITKEKNLHSLKSCDALKIIPSHNRIDFIEMKGVREMVMRWGNSSSDTVLDKKVEKKVKRYNFIGKIEDSLTILKILTTTREITFNDKTRLHYLNTQKNFVILTDIEPEENWVRYISLGFEAIAVRIQWQVEMQFMAELDSIPTNLAPNFQPPILKNCREIDQYYASL